MRPFKIVGIPRRIHRHRQPGGYFSALRDQHGRVERIALSWRRRMRHERRSSPSTKAPPPPRRSSYDSPVNLLDKASIEHRQIYPQPGWVEHDAEEIWRNTLDVIRRVKCERSDLPQHHEPARNDRRVRSCDRKAAAQRDCLAMPARAIRSVRELSRAGHDRAWSRKDWTDDRSRIFPHPSSPG